MSVCVTLFVPFPGSLLLILSIPCRNRRAFLEEHATVLPVLLILIRHFDKIRALALEHFPTRFQLSAIFFLHLKANISCHLMFSPFHCLVCFASIGCWIMCQVPLLDDIHNMLMVDTLQHSLVEQSSQQNVWIDGYIWDNMKFPLKFSISSQPGWQAGTIKVTLAMQFW